MVAALIAPGSGHQPPRDGEVKADRNTLPSAEFEVVVVNFAKELEELFEGGVISIEQKEWLEECGRIFGLRPRDIFDWFERPLHERFEVLKQARVNIGVLRESYMRDFGIDGLEPEKVAKLIPPADYAAHFIARKAVELGLVEPVRVWLGEESEVRLLVKRYAREEGVEGVAKILALAGQPYYSPSRLSAKIATSLEALARAYPREAVNPPQLLNLANGAIHLESLTEVTGNGYIFTYELPAVNPFFIKALREDRIDEAYFVSKPFYQLIRPHYSEKEWEKLKAVLGAALAPFSLKLIAIIHGPHATRKTFLFKMMQVTLGKLAATVRLKQLEKERFALQHAIGARVLITSEEAQTVVHNIDILKSVSGGDPLYIDRKNKVPIVLVHNPMKVYIFSNGLPRFRNYDEAFVQRLVLIETANPLPMDSERRELWNKSEQRPQEFLEFLLWCYWNLKRQGFVIPEQGSEEYVDKLLEGQSNVFAFAEELAGGEIDLGNVKVAALFGRYKTKGSELYDIYCEWARLRGEAPEGRNTFYQLIETALREKGVVKTTERETVVFRGIKLLTRPVETVDTESLFT